MCSSDLAEQFLIKFGAKENEEVNIVHNTIRIELGGNNVIGIDILKKALIAFDLHKYNAGIALLEDNGSAYVINWPIDSFGDNEFSHKGKKVSDSYVKLAKSLKKIEIENQRRIDDYLTVIKEREKNIKELQKELEDLKKELGIKK